MSGHLCPNHFAARVLLFHDPRADLEFDHVTSFRRLIRDREISTEILLRLELKFMIEIGSRNTGYTNQKVLCKSSIVFGRESYCGNREKLPPILARRLAFVIRCVTALTKQTKKGRINF